MLAGPLCSMMLGDLGADIIKVENPTTGDETRDWGPPWVGENDKLSAYYVCVNRNKRSICLNLKTSEGQDIAWQLAEQSHIIIENFKPGQMNKFGLGYEQVNTLYPHLVYCSISGFGQTGPYRDRPGYDFVIQAMSGLMSLTGPVDQEPYKVGVAVSDVFTALYACNAIQAALRYSEKTGQGQHIDMALYDAQLGALVNIAGNYLVSGENPKRYGNQHANIVPYQTFKAIKGEFVLAVGNDRQFNILCDLIERPDLKANPQFATNPARVQNRETLIPVLNEIFRTKSATHWVNVLLDAGIPAGHINTVEEALTDPNTDERNMVENVQLADDTNVNLIASPMKLSLTSTQTRLPPPLHGQHTDVILKERLHLDNAALAELRKNNVIA